MDWVYIIFALVVYAVYRFVKHFFWDDEGAREFYLSALKKKPICQSQPLQQSPTSFVERKQGEGDPEFAAYLRGYNEGYQRGKSEGFSDGYASGTMFRH